MFSFASLHWMWASQKVSMGHASERVLLCLLFTPTDLFQAVMLWLKLPCFAYVCIAHATLNGPLLRQLRLYRCDKKQQHRRSRFLPEMKFFRPYFAFIEKGNAFFRMTLSLRVKVLCLRLRAIWQYMRALCYECVALRWAVSDIGRNQSGTCGLRLWAVNVLLFIK